jgi:hypothetical protein
MGCENTTVYLAPGVKASLRQLKITALLGDERIEITHRSQIRELEETRGWNGLCQVESRDSGESRVVRIDSRVAYGHLPENAAWWRLGEVAGGKSLDAVGGAKQFSEVLFGKSSKVLGRAAYEAVRSGHGYTVAVVAGMTGGRAGCLVEPDVLARLLTTVASHPSQALYQTVDPEAYRAGYELLAMLPADRRGRVLLEMLTALPKGVTPDTAVKWAGDPDRRTWLVEQGSWPVIAAVLDAAGELDDETLARYEKMLRSRGIIGAVAAGEITAAYAGAGIPALREEIEDVLDKQARAHLELEGSSADERFVQDLDEIAGQLMSQALCRLSPEKAAKLYEEIIRSDYVETRTEHLRSLHVLYETDPEAASRVVREAMTSLDGRVRESASAYLSTLVEHINGGSCEMSEMVEMVEMVEAALGDEVVEVRRAAARALYNISQTDPAEALRLWTQALDDPDESTVSHAIQQLCRQGSRICEADPDEVLRLMLSRYDEALTRSTGIGVAGYTDAQFALAEAREAAFTGRDDESARQKAAVVNKARQAAQGLVAVGTHHPGILGGVLDETLTRVRAGSRESGVLEWAVPVLVAGVCLHTPERGVEVMQDLMRTPFGDRRLRDDTIRGALQAFAAGGSEVGISFLEDAAEGANLRDACTAISFLHTAAAVFPEQVLRTVERALSATRVEIRSAAAAPLIELFLTGEPRAADVLLRAVREDRSTLEQALNMAGLIGEKSPEVAGEVFRCASEAGIPLHEHIPPLIRTDPERAAEALYTKLHVPTEDHQYHQDSAALMLPDLAEQLPEAARVLAASIPSDTRIDPEILLNLAGAGLPVHSPVPESLVGVLRAVNADPELASELREARSYTQVVELGNRFAYAPETVQRLDSQPVEVQGEPYTTRVIRSGAELERNGEAMRNCTGGYAAALRRGEVMLAVQDNTGRVRYNAHLIPKRGGWVVGEVNSFANHGGVGVDEIRAWAEGAVQNLPSESSIEDDPIEW